MLEVGWSSSFSLLLANQALLFTAKLKLELQPEKNLADAPGSCIVLTTILEGQQHGT